MIVHRPADFIVTVVPLTVQTVAVLDENVTASDDVAVALTANVPAPPATNVGGEIGVKLIVCAAGAIANVCGTSGADR